MHDSPHAEAARLFQVGLISHGVPVGLEEDAFYFFYQVTDGIKFLYLKQLIYTVIKVNSRALIDSPGKKRNNLKLAHMYLDPGMLPS